MQPALRGIDINENIVTAQAGEDWDDFVEFCVAGNLQGVECLSGIPGLIGGTPVQNVGAYGQEVSETISKVRVFDRKTEQILELSNSECKFAYRASIFNTTDKNRFIILAVDFALRANGEPKIVYRDLLKIFERQNPTLAETRAAVLQIRRAKSMLIDENDPNSKSAGSFFKNSIISNEKFAEIKEKIQKLKIKCVPNYKVDEKLVKIPAAWLIEQSGFDKGFRLGNAGISTAHTLAIVNLGRASAAEILELKNKIQSQVKVKFGIDLMPEPIFIGFTET